MYANTTSIFVFGHGVGYTVEKAVEAATTHSDENGARKRKPFASGHKGAKETHMGMTIAQKILKAHLVDGEMVLGQEIGLKIDQTLTQDATGTMAYLQLEAMGVDQVKTDLSVSYVDHNTLQSGFENADDHKYLQTVAARHGVLFSRAGNGICHQVHLERFAKPGCTLLGSDSHTPTAGGIGALAIGAGGLDVACAMAGRPFHLRMPKIIGVELKNALRRGVSSKDIILKVLQMLSVKGGVGCVLEYFGDGVKTLSVPQRATITNMGAELGATSSLFPSDENTLAFLKQQGREEDFSELQPDEDVVYDSTITIDLAQLEPMIALPHSPDHVCAVSEVAGMKIDQVCIGSCTNSSYHDLVSVGNILKGKHVHPNVSLTVSPGSRQIFMELSRNGTLSDLIAAGARILECTCGPCIGMGQSPITDAVSLRTFNRNFYGRSGTLSAKVCLVSPETAALSAINGELSSPLDLPYEIPQEPAFMQADMSMFIEPERAHPETVEVVRGPNIRPLPMNTALPDTIDKKVMIKVEDNITTDHIAPAGAKVLPYRSNIEKISTFVFMNNKADFHDCCKANGGGYIIAGANYGQGSSREHAALAPMYLGIKAVIAKSFARIHKANLINFGILPLTFLDEADYARIDDMDELRMEHVRDLRVDGTLTVENVTKGIRFEVGYDLSELDIETLRAGGTLNLIRAQQ